MDSFLFIIPNCMMEVNVWQNEQMLEFDCTPPLFILRHNQGNESLVFPPSFLAPQLYPEWIILNLIGNLSMVWISSFYQWGIILTKPLILGAGTQAYDRMILKMRTLMRLYRA